MTDSAKRFTSESWNMEDEIQREIDLNFIDRKSDLDYKSIVLLELFELKEFELLEESLKELYKDLDPHHLDRSIKIIQSKNHSGYAFDRLPEIRNSKYAYKSFYYGVKRDLGKNFKYLNIRLTRISYSNIILEIHGSLTPQISKKMKDLMFEDYNEFVSVAKESLIGLFKFDIDNTKTERIIEFRQKLRKELIQIISNFFRGYFIKSDMDNMPAIDVFCLNYPENEKDLIKWGEKHGKFIGTCFQTYISSEMIFERNIYDRILLLLCKSHFDFYGHIILANRIKLSPRIDEEQNIDLFIQNTLISSSFSLIAIQKRVQNEVKKIGELNLTISKKIENVDDLNLEKTLDCIKNLSKKLYYFKRIKMELDSVNYNYVHLFKSLEEKKDFFIELQKNIFDTIKNNENILKILNENLSQFLDLKNIEYSKKTQESNYKLSERVLNFTIIIGILAVGTAIIQIIIAILKP